jgi:hypothetical protein
VEQKLIWLMIGPGTLPSQGVDRMDMLRYAVWISGRPPLTGRELIAALPEVNRIAKLDVDDGNPYAIDSGNSWSRAGRKLAASCSSKGPTASRRPPIS